MFYKRLCAEEIGRKFEVSDDQLLDVQRRMTEAVNKGLGKSTQSASSVKCWDTYIDYPTPATGSFPAPCAFDTPVSPLREFLSLNMSHATRIMVRHTTISPRDRINIKYLERHYPKMKTGSGRQLFDQAAEQLAEFTTAHKVETTDMPLEFTFGFPVQQTSLGQGILYRWTKEFNYRTELVSTNVVDGIRDSLARLNVNMGHVAVINDVTSSLIDMQVAFPNARVGLVVDEGCNCCFVDRVANVRDRRIEGKDAAAINTVVNTEWGAFGENGELDDVRNALDRHMDVVSLQPGKQIFEKLTSGEFCDVIDVHIRTIHFACLKVCTWANWSGCLSCPWRKI
jgi:hexokinase